MKIKMKNLRRVITEALKKNDVEKLASSLEIAGNKLGNVSVNIDDNSKVFNVFVKHHFGDENEIERALVDVANKSGWSLLSKSDRRGLTWWFEPDADVKGSIRRQRIPSVLYHGTASKNIDDILEQGLVPKLSQRDNTTRKYSPRIYLSASPKGANTTSVEGGWTVLKINTEKLPKDIKFYVDQEFGFSKDGKPKAVYTTQPIPTDAIEI
jgi:hypothetical protein